MSPCCSMAASMVERACSRVRPSNRSREPSAKAATQRKGAYTLASFIGGASILRLALHALFHGLEDVALQALTGGSGGGADFLSLRFQGADVDIVALFRVAGVGCFLVLTDWHSKTSFCFVCAL